MFCHATARETQIKAWSWKLFEPNRKLRYLWLDIVLQSLRFVRQKQELIIITWNYKTSTEPKRYFPFSDKGTWSAKFKSPWRPDVRKWSLWGTLKTHTLQQRKVKWSNPASFEERGQPWIVFFSFESKTVFSQLAEDSSWWHR